MVSEGVLKNVKKKFGVRSAPELAATLRRSMHPPRLAGSIPHSRHIPRPHFNRRHQSEPAPHPLDSSRSFDSNAQEFTLAGHIC
jgi:hypothetical protein